MALPTRVALALMLLAGGAAAQQPAACTDAERHQFDFWIGDWTVTDSAGAVTMGTNRVTQEEAGCLVHEHWAGSRGGTGQSFNYFDRSRKVWVQQWVGSGGESLRVEGRLQDGRMVLEGESVNPKGARVLHRAIWSRESDGRVRQYWRTSADGGATWQILIDGYYRKKS